MKNTIIIFLTLWSFCLYAQDKGIQQWRQDFNDACTSNLDSAKIIANNIYTLQAQLLTKDKRLAHYHLKGDIYHHYSDFKNAKLQYDSALMQVDEHTPQLLKAELLINSAGMNSLLSHFDIAGANYYAGLEIYQTLNDTTLQAETLISIAEYYRRAHKLDKAEKYLQKAENLCSEELLNSAIGVSLYNRYAAIYNKTERRDKGIEASFKSLEIAKRIGNKNAEASNYNEIGYHYDNNISKELAIEYYTKALNIWESIDNQRSCATALINLARSESSVGNDDQAIRHLKYLEKIVEGKGWLNVELEMYRQQRRSYKQVGNYKDALTAYEKHDKLYTDLLKKEHDNKILENEFNYELKERDLLLSQHQEKLAIIKNKRQHWLLINILFILLSLILSILYFTLRQKRKALALSNIQLDQKAKENEQLTKEIHHRVKNNLNMLSGMLLIQKNNIADDRTKQLMDNMHMRIDVISQIHKQLLDSANKPHIIASEFFTHLILNLELSMCRSKLKIKTDFENGDTVISLKKAIPLALIVNEMLTNAVKYGPCKQGNEIGFYFKRIDNKITIEVYDNGKGIKNQNIIFKPKTTGMKLISTFIKQLNACLEYERKPLSKFRFSLYL